MLERAQQMSQAKARLLQAELQKRIPGYAIAVRYNESLPPHPDVYPYEVKCGNLLMPLSAGFVDGVISIDEKKCGEFAAWLRDTVKARINAWKKMFEIAYKEKERYVQM